MADRLVFENSQEEFFSKFGLKSFDDFFDYSEGEIIDKNTKRNVTILNLGDDAEKKIFFMNPSMFYTSEFKLRCCVFRCQGMMTAMLD